MSRYVTTLFPVSFVFAENIGVIAQPLTFALCPLRLIVAEPSEDAVLDVQFGNAQYRFEDWSLPPGQTVHARELQAGTLVPFVWSQGTEATLTLLSGTVTGAALVCARSDTVLWHRLGCTLTVSST